MKVTANFEFFSCPYFFFVRRGVPQTVPASPDALPLGPTPHRPRPPHAAPRRPRAAPAPLNDTHGSLARRGRRSPAPEGGERAGSGPRGHGPGALGQKRVRAGRGRGGRARWGRCGLRRRRRRRSGPADRRAARGEKRLPCRAGAKQAREAGADCSRPGSRRLSVVTDPAAGACPSSLTQQLAPVRRR